MNDKSERWRDNGGGGKEAVEGKLGLLWHDDVDFIIIILIILFLLSK